MRHSDKAGGTPYLMKYRWPVGVLAISQPSGSGTSSGMIGVAAASASASAWAERELTGREAGEEWARTWWGAREPHTPPSELAWRERSRVSKSAAEWQTAIRNINWEQKQNKFKWVTKARLYKTCFLTLDSITAKWLHCKTKCTLENGRILWCNISKLISSFNVAFFLHNSTKKQISCIDLFA